MGFSTHPINSKLTNGVHGKGISIPRKDSIYHQLGIFQEVSNIVLVWYVKATGMQILCSNTRENLLLQFMCSIVVRSDWDSSQLIVPKFWPLRKTKVPSWQKKFLRVHCHFLDKIFYSEKIRYLSVFPYKEYFLFLVIWTTFFPLKEAPSFFGTLFQKQYYFVSQIQSFRNRLNNQMAAIMLPVIPSSYASYSKVHLFSFANRYEKCNLSKYYCMAQHDNKICLLTFCRYHNRLIGVIEKLMPNLDAFCSSTDQQVDCLYTSFKYHFSYKSALKIEKKFEDVQRAVYFNRKAEYKMPSIAKKHGQSTGNSVSFKMKSL